MSDGDALSMPALVGRCLADSDSTDQASIGPAVWTIDIPSA